MALELVQSVRPGAYTSLSILEDTLLRSSEDFLYVFFEHWNPRQILRLGRTNRRLHRVVELYFLNVWCPENHLRQYFFNIHALVEFLETTGSVIFGPSVVLFFERRKPTGNATIDMCVENRSISKLVRFMEGSFFSLEPGQFDGRELEPFTVVDLVDAMRSRRNIGQDTAVKDLKTETLILRYRKSVMEYGVRKIVNLRVHLVGYAPYQHILSLRSSGMMNYITHSHAISLFPYSSFVTRKSFVSRRDDKIRDDDSSEFKVWYSKYARLNGIEVVDITATPYDRVEVGNRYVGDRKTWTIPMEASTRRINTSRYVGPAFEVLSWTSGVTDPDAYLRIGEPRVLGMWSRYRYASLFASDAFWSSVMRV